MNAGLLLLVAVLGVLLLLVLVMFLRIQAFVALLIVSLFVGVGAGMPTETILEAITQGMGGTLGHVAVVVGLGSMFGQMLESSGGARRMADSLISGFGTRRAPVALALAGFLIAVPTMFEVGFIVLIPLVFALSRQADEPLLKYAMPLLTGLAVGHAFMPPTAAPVAVAKVLNADLGRVILYGALTGLPTALVVGPLWGNWIGKRITFERTAVAEAPTSAEGLPSFAMVMGLVVFPIGLIVARTLAPNPVLNFLGHPVVALLLATLASFWLLGVRRGMPAREVQRQANLSLHSAGLILLVIGGGGAFKQVLVDSGIGKALAQSLAGLPVSGLVLSFLLAAVVRVSQGSATVAMMTAAGLASDLSGDPALKVIAIGAGGTVLSHVNDAGFWLVKEYLGMTEAQTLRSWTVLTTLIGVVALGFLMLWSVIAGSAAAP